MEMDFWTLDSFFDYVLSVIVFTLTLTSSRKFWLWYWKIDVIVGLLESIDKKMGATTNQGTDLDPKKIRKTISKPTTTNTHDHLLQIIPNNIVWTPTVWITIIAIIIGILVYLAGINSG